MAGLEPHRDLARSFSSSRLALLAAGGAGCEVPSYELVLKRSFPKIQKTTIDKDGEMGSADFEMSASLSPGKLDRHLEKILNE